MHDLPSIKSDLRNLERLGNERIQVNGRETKEANSEMMSPNEIGVAQHRYTLAESIKRVNIVY